MKNNRLWVLGASDPEMSAIETLLVRRGEEYIFATDKHGVRVHPGNAYKGFAKFPIGKPANTVYFVECRVNGMTRKPGFRTVYFVECRADAICEDGVVREIAAELWSVDHHSPGDSGWGERPENFWLASSIGQVWEVLHRCPRDCPLINAPIECGAALNGELGDLPEECLDHPLIMPDPPKELLLVAAADHCLLAAYEGQCPGVSPDELMKWRAESRAAFQKRSVEEILKDVSAAMEKIKAAKTFYLRPCTGGIDDHEHSVYCGCSNPPDGDFPVKDMTGEIIPELPEAAARLGVAVLAGPLKTPDGREKMVLQSAPPGTIEEFLNGAPDRGFAEGHCLNLVDFYGDPERGFAGGYKKKS